MITETSLVKRIHSLAVQARATGKVLCFFDVRYATSGIPDEITDTYVYFNDPIEIVETGKLGTAATSVERGCPKVLLLSTVISIEIILPPKVAK